MRLLSKNQIDIKLSSDNRYVIASLYENNGYREWEKFKLSELPNNLISLDNLKRFGVNIIDMEPSRSA